jgi:hypothetical protein
MRFTVRSNNRVSHRGSESTTPAWSYNLHTKDRDLCVVAHNFLQNTFSSSYSSTCEAEKYIKGLIS